MTFQEIIDRPQNAPNSVIEELATKGKRCFGRYIPLPALVKEFFRQELNRRNSEGEMIFRSYSERKKFRCMNTTLVGARKQTN